MGVGRPKGLQYRIDLHAGASLEERAVQSPRRPQQVRMMAPRVRGHAGGLNRVGGTLVKMVGRFENGMVRPRRLRSGCRQHQQAGQLRGNLAKVLEVFAGFDDIRCRRVVYRITNGFGLLPEMSIHTLFVCKYSRMASAPLSRPMPDRL